MSSPPRSSFTSTTSTARGTAAAAGAAAGAAATTRCTGRIARLRERKRLNRLRPAVTVDHLHRSGRQLLQRRIGRVDVGQVDAAAEHGAARRVGRDRHRLRVGRRARAASDRGRARAEPGSALIRVGSPEPDIDHRLGDAGQRARRAIERTELLEPRRHLAVIDDRGARIHAASIIVVGVRNVVFPPTPLKVLPATPANFTGDPRKIPLKTHACDARRVTLGYALRGRSLCASASS